jgi:hypothetical protein
MTPVAGIAMAADHYRARAAELLAQSKLNRTKLLLLYFGAEAGTLSVTPFIKRTLSQCNKWPSDCQDVYFWNLPGTNLF